MNELSADDMKLIQECIRNNRYAQEKLYAKFYGKMFTVSKRYIRNTEDAQEVLSISFLKVFNNLKKFSSKGNLESWIRRIVVNTAIDYLRERKKYSNMFLCMDDFHGFSEPVEFDEIETSALLNIPAEEYLKLVHELPPASRSVFNLYVIDEYSHKEIAGMLGINEGTSKWHLHEARRKLKNLILERFDTRINYGQR